MNNFVVDDQIDAMADRNVNSSIILTNRNRTDFIFAEVDGSFWSHRTANGTQINFGTNVNSMENYLETL